MRVWYPDRIETLYSEDDRSDPKTIDTADNQIGRIPAVILYNSKRHKKGIGISDMADIADLQKAIYNELSEIEQLILSRNKAREIKDFKKADKIRDELESMGVTLEDSKDGTTWKMS